MAASRPTLQANTITIIGDGPIALMLAIKLKQLKIKNVIVVGPRLNEFTRSGDLNAAAFKEVNTLIAPCKVDPLKGNNIKDLERGLYLHAGKLGVKLVQRKFVRLLDSNHIQVMDMKQQSTSDLETDLVIDCTGTKRAVITNFNDQHSVPYFNFEDHSDFFPHQHFTLLRLLVGKSEISGFLQDNFKINPVCYAVGVEKLRALGWQGNAIPFATTIYPEVANQAVVPAAAAAGKAKVNLYFHAPRDLDQNQAIEFANILCWIYQGDPTADVPRLETHHESRKHPDKKVVSHFDLHIHQITPGCFLGNASFPPILHQGDATVNLPFLTGLSLILGIERLEMFLADIEIHEGKIVNFDREAYEAFLEQQLSYIIKILTDHSQQQEDWLEQFADIDQINILYEAALRLTKNPEQIQLIQQGLAKLYADYVMQNLNKKVADFNAIENSETGFESKFLVADKIKSISEFIDSAYQYEKYLSAVQQSQLEQFAIEFARSLQAFGRYYLALKPYAPYKLAEKCFKDALRIFEYFSANFQKEQLAVYADLIKSAAKQMNYDDVIDWVALCEQKILKDFVVDAQSEKIVDKIYYHAVQAVLEKIDKLSRTGQLRSPIACSLLSSGYGYVAKLSVASSATADDLQKKLGDIERQINNPGQSYEVGRRRRIP